METFKPYFQIPAGLKPKVWVLAPQVETNDENLDYYYDFSQSIAEYKSTFSKLGLDWCWQPVTLVNYHDIIIKIREEQEAAACFPIVFNLCDGDETNGSLGISIVRFLEANNLVYTGAEAFFYEITTSKLAMKAAFDKKGIPTPPWEAITALDQNLEGIFERLGCPIIVKPSVSGGSMGVGTKNVVHNISQLNSLVTTMFEGYRGWNLVTDGLVAESFIAGREFTCFIAGSASDPGNANIYEPVERIFHPSLPEEERFLSFDRLWEIYEEESAMPGEENFYEYAPVEAALIAGIKSLSWKAYDALKGTGYTRVDIRMNHQTGELYVLEANAQCGISEDENFTSIGAILKVSGKAFSELVSEIINDALYRFSLRNCSSLSSNEYSSPEKENIIMKTPSK